MSERLEHVVDWELGDGNTSAHHLGNNISPIQFHVHEIRYRYCWYIKRCVSVRDYTSVLYEHVIATAMVNASIISDASVGSSDCEHICNNSVHGALGPCDSHETHQPSMLPKPIPRDFTVCCRSCIGHTSMSTRCMNTYGLSDDHTEHCCSFA